MKLIDKLLQKTASLHPRIELLYRKHRKRNGLEIMVKSSTEDLLRIGDQAGNAIAENAPNKIFLSK